MMLPVLCLNGPNLDMLGTRQPHVYGSSSLGELESSIVEWGEALGLQVSCRQSNDEAEIIEWLHGADDQAGVVLNPGALTHTSAAIGDAVASLTTPVVEVHLSNVRSRQRWRRRSFVAPVAAATIYGRGPEGYQAALRHLVNRHAHPMETSRYGPHPDQVFDLRRAGRTGVILLHGGFWLDVWGRDLTETWAVDLARRGIASANLEYRRLGSGGGAVATISDVSRGLADAAHALGADPAVVVGHSAGAHLALAAARRSGFPAQAVVSVGGLLDLEEAKAAGRADGAVSRFDPGCATSPLAASPPAVPVVLAHGGADTVVPPEHSRRYAHHLTEKGSSAPLTIVDDVGHFDALDPSGPLWWGLLDALRSLGVGPSHTSF